MTSNLFNWGDQNAAPDPQSYFTGATLASCFQSHRSDSSHAPEAEL